VLITGATGLLGPYLADAARGHGRVVTSGRRDGDVQLDLCDRPRVAEALASLGPALVIHAAAMTDVERCEREPREADRSNRLATAHLTEALPPGCRLVYLSTDQVYPDLPGPHAEPDTGPVNEYGRSKLAGEHEARAALDACVLRINFVGPSRTPGRSSLSDVIIETLGGGRPMTVFDDVWFSPLHVLTLADLVMECARSSLAGVFNLGAREGMTKAAFAFALARAKGLPTGTATAGSSDSVPGRVARPHDLRMDVAKIEGALGRIMPTVGDEILKL
jgi:dTDP-4-dehydrorhamnose reductase